MLQLLPSLQIEVGLGKNYFEQALTKMNLLILYKSSQNAWGT